MDAPRIAASVFLPWLLGIAVLLALPRSRERDAPGELAWTLGAGYLLGAFALTLWMRVLSATGVRLGLASVALPLLAIMIATGAFAWQTAGRPSMRALRERWRTMLVPQFPDSVTRALWWTMLAWMALRFVLLGLEVALQPLYPWDAWIQWATKARAWYGLGYLVPFGTASDWFAATGTVYFDASPYYPPTVPLLQVWTCLVLGRWDDALMNWPWWQTLLALVLATYGGLRCLGAGRLTALAGSFLVATLPLLDTHVALAGYADLPMAAFYTVAGLATLRWSLSRTRTDAAIALVFAVACTQVKNPGLPWALTLLPGVLVIMRPRDGVRAAAYLLAGALLLVAVLAQTHPVILHYRLHLDFEPAWAALGQSYFLLGNWHLLWYGVIAAALLARRALLLPPLLPLTMIVGAGVLFLFVVFGFTNARMWVADQTSINRATLHLAPLMVIFGVLAFQAFARQWARRTRRDETTSPVAIEAAAGQR